MADKTKIPKTIGVIMDGNRRWAKLRELPSLKGHEAGYERYKEFIRWSKQLGIKTIYFYAFSTENWNRSKSEVGYLMKLFLTGVSKEAQNIVKEKVRVKFVGQIERFSPAIRFGMRKLERVTAKFTDMTILICLSYGGRAEIINAIKELSKKESAGKIANLDEATFSEYLWTAGYPDPELVIRTSGEIRTSNFLPWQSAYSEWFFTKTFWPAFTRGEFEKILKEYSTRQIRRGR